ncbi:hypothetical protein VTJ04DRAFT_2176 [Mycothermus thermophilus]|uniref:uncharacterized protein n=1 Tax=Humicola insolens TaxID=85995 RepID=UPI003743A725
MLYSTVLLGVFAMKAAALPQAVWVCGNGVVDPGEECDLGWGRNGAYNSGCSLNCKTVLIIEQVCGNGVVEGDEECDDGPDNGKDTSDYGEECDDGPDNGSATSTCDATCRLKDTGSGGTCQTCDPNPFLNQCTITTSCINTHPYGKYYCACRAGYRADGLAPTNPRQFRLKFIGQEYRVFVAPGIECNTLCTNPFPGPDSCQEVPVGEGC